ncbi:MAG: hypothetical protein K8J08_03305, partial [Thermoanaerobaculia bacterium]|nr:hypothetical protein [Thermoanaerobaculia bacterium]
MDTLRFQGILLFLFIPVVLGLFVLHPPPIAGSLATGIVLMIGHRFLARPYMLRALPRKCLWCNRLLEDAVALENAVDIPLETAGGPLTAQACREHAPPLQKYLTCLDDKRWILRLGIFVPLLALLGCLTLAAFGRNAPLEEVTALFRLIVGVTVNIAAFGYLWQSPRSPTT